MIIKIPNMRMETFTATEHDGDFRVVFLNDFALAAMNFRVRPRLE
jgi:hypothetical protein